MIRVRGVSKNSSDETLEYFFENKRRSGGGDVKHVHLDPDTGVAIVTFEEPAVVKRVLEKNKEQTFQVDSATLTVEEYEPPPLEKRKAYVSGIPDGVDEDALIKYLEDQCQTEVVSEVVFGDKPGTAIITFDATIDVDDLDAQCRQRRMKGSALKVHPVHSTNCILIRGVTPAVSADHLELYFNSTKSGGGDLERVARKEGTGVVLVYFTKYNDAKRVCRRPVHTVADVDLRVSLYYECLGMPKFSQEMGQTESKGVKQTASSQLVKIENLDKNTLQFVHNSDKYRLELEKELKSISGQIMWPGDDAGRIDVACSSANLKLTAEDFESKIKSEVYSFMAQFTYVVIVVAKGIWEEISAVSFQLKPASANDLNVIQKKDACQIVLVGKTKAVDDAKEQINASIQKSEEVYSKEHEIITDRVTLKWHQVAILQAIDFENELAKEFKQLHLKYECGSNPGVGIEGKAGDAISIKKRIFETVADIVSDQLPLSTLEQELFLLEESEKYIREEVSKIELPVVWNKPSGTGQAVLNLYGYRTEHLRQVKHILKAKILVRSIDLDSCKKQALESKAWAKEKKRLEKLYSGKLIIEEEIDKIVIVATDDIADDVLENLEEFFDVHAVGEDFVPMEEPIFRYLKDYGKDAIKALEGQFSSSVKSLYPDRRSEGPGYRIEGTQEGCAALASRLGDLQDSIKCHQHVISSIPGVHVFFSSSEGLDALKSVEERENCVIDLILQTHDTNAVAGERAVCNLGSRRIVVIKGNMLEIKADIIVVATNQKLELRSGLGLALRQKGNQIQRECDAVVAKHGKEGLRRGEIAVTGAENLTFQKIVHAVCPHWENDRPYKSNNLLANIIDLSLQEAEKHQLRSIAFPALGSGNFRFPVKASTREIVQEIKVHFGKTERKHAPSLQSIILCDTNEEAVEQFVKALEDIFGRGSVKKTTGGKKGNKEDNEDNDLEVVSSDSDATDDEDDADFQGNTNPTATAFKPVHHAGNIQVAIVKGVLAKHKADVLVNSTSNNLDLSKGLMSKLMLDVGGPTLQTECNSNYPNGISPGDVAVTTGGTLACQKVFHGCLPKWDGGKGTALKILGDFMTKCLHTASTSGLTSIAFPALGTGGLKFPADKVAKLMFDCVHTFEKQNPSAGVKTVNIVIYHKDLAILKAFQHVQSGYSSSSGGCFQVDKIILEIEQGDITKESCDVIVSNVLPGCNLESGGILAKSILHSAGQTIKAEFANEAAKMEKQKYVVTSGGNLQCKKIFHVGLGGKSKDNEWDTAINSCLTEADRMGFTSISFPALGAGGMGRPVGKVAKTMVSAVKQFSSSGTQRNLTKVRFVIFQTGMVDAFTSAVTGKQTTKSVAEKSKKPQKSQSDERVVLNIYCDSMEPVKGAKLRIDEIVKKKFENKTIFPTLGVVKSLPDRQVHKIELMGSECDVLVKLKRETGEIKMQGLRTNVAVVEKKIQTYLDNIEKDYKTKQEQKHKEQLEKAKAAAEKAKAAASEGNLPKTWSPMAPTELFKLVPLTTTDAEYVNISQKFTATGGGVTAANIISIERIQNPAVYKQYQVKKKQMEKANAGSQFPVERELWHGTRAKASVDNIINNGFNRNYTTAAAYGVGVYFGVTAQTSIGYTSPDAATGNKYILYANVLTGDPCVGNGQMRALPPKNAAAPHILHDSACSSISGPWCFVIFHDSQAYPAYLITFK